MLQRHAGDSYGYRFEADGRSVIYTTDSEHKLDDPMETDTYAAFFRNADLVIFDAMYSLADAVSVRADWGHSSNVVGVELCQMAGARHLCLFHHEPAYSDQAIDAVLADTRRLEEITRTGAATHHQCRLRRHGNRVVKPTAASAPDARRIGRIRLVGIAVLVALAVLIGREASVTSLLSAPWFDAYQAVAPRIAKSMPAVVVEIDQKSLKEVGQWPWPRNKMAELVEAIRREHPAAIALDILMPEVDALSPERLLVRGAKDDAALAAALAGRPSNDALLARALAAARAVLVVAGMPEATGMPLRAPAGHNAQLVRD